MAVFFAIALHRGNRDDRSRHPRDRYRGVPMCRACVGSPTTQASAEVIGTAVIGGGHSARGERDALPQRGISE